MLATWKALPRSDGLNDLSEEPVVESEPLNQIVPLVPEEIPDDGLADPGTDVSILKIFPPKNLAFLSFLKIF
jgi:hypothetical protein